MQTLSVNGFLGIKSAEIEVDLVTIIIGEQATGKSIIARLIYFFNEYFANFDELSLSKGEHKSSYDKRKKAEFCQIFPPYSWEESAFSLVFNNGDHTVSITSSGNSSAITLKTSPGVAKQFQDLKREFAKFSAQFGDEPFAQTRVLRDFRRIQDETGVPRYESPLFVPAARSFYATIRDEIFSILALDNKIDQIILQFGEFYETAKLRAAFAGLASVNPARSINKAREKAYFDKVVGGHFVREDGRDWIEMARGRIELSKASSGQQEATPLLLAISRFPAQGRTLIVEEPEAHLFPTAQVSILDFMLLQALQKKTSIIFTTHSPYLLSAMNNYLMRYQVGMAPAVPPDAVRAYCIEGGVARSLIDSETSLISADYIDSASEGIAAEFEEALEVMSANE